MVILWDLDLKWKVESENTVAVVATATEELKRDRAMKDGT
jgi:hypothetical protein